MVSTFAMSGCLLVHWGFEFEFVSASNLCFQKIVNVLHIGLSLSLLFLPLSFSVRVGVETTIFSGCRKFFIHSKTSASEWTRGLSQFIPTHTHTHTHSCSVHAFSAGRTVYHLSSTCFYHHRQRLEWNLIFWSNWPNFGSFRYILLLLSPTSPLSSFSCHSFFLPPFSTVIFSMSDSFSPLPIMIRV